MINLNTLYFLVFLICCTRTQRVLKTPPPQYSQGAKSIIPGIIYQHYKGPQYRYRALHLARDAETLEEQVVYQALYGEGDIWIRPVSMFLEIVQTNAGKQKRFEPLPIYNQ